MSASVAETHLSVVVFVGDRAYKLKKPVSLPFADFSTREARRAACEREVELNRRLAPDVYLGVADVSGPDGRLCDHLVVMRRMPDERRLSTLVAEGVDVEAELRRVAEVVAEFHARAATSPSTAEAGRAAAVRRNWTDNVEQMRSFVGTVLDPALSARVAELAFRYLDGRAPLFDRRINDGRVRDGHGDLLADDIFCLDDGPRVLDCIEFDDRLRHGDVLADVAFLAMDLERLGKPQLGERFLAWYAERSGDRWPASLSHHYIAYRAQVRSKVACVRHTQGDGDAALAAASLLDLALDHLERGRVMLVLVGGLPGSGKSTLAAALGKANGWVVLRSDVVRKELVGMAADEAAPASFQQGLYRPDHTDATYRELLERAESHLSMGDSVVLDASWTAGHHRDDAVRAALATTSDLVELRCDAPAALREQRLASRGTRRDVSDADADIAEAMAAQADPWPSAAVIDTSGPVDASVTAARIAIEAANLV